MAEVDEFEDSEAKPDTDQSNTVSDRKVRSLCLDSYSYAVHCGHGTVSGLSCLSLFVNKVEEANGG